MSHTSRSTNRINNMSNISLKKLFLNIVIKFGARTVLMVMASSLLVYSNTVGYRPDTGLSPVVWFSREMSAGKNYINY